MGGMTGEPSDRNRRRNKATSEANKRWAEARRCPKCNRKSALRRQRVGLDWLVTCRWKDCDYERMHLAP